jgi:preprotein translocase subunit SecF
MEYRAFMFIEFSKAIALALIHDLVYVYSFFLCSRHFSKTSIVALYPIYTLERN